MDFLKAEIARKKQQIQQTEVLAPGKKFFKRADLAAKQEEEYWKKCKRLRNALTEKEGEQSARDAFSSGDENSRSSEDAVSIQLPRKEVIRRLRERNEPILLFGETEYEAFQRLKNLEINMPEINKGFKNDFKAALAKVDEDYLKEILNSTQQSSTDDKKQNADVTVKEAKLTIEEILDKAKGMGKGDHNLDCEVVLNFYKLLLQMWGDRLNGRSQQEKLGFSGKMASAIHRQTVEYIKPLFRKLKKKELPREILACMVDIVRYMMDRDYLRANDAYLEMAIGNAPWPIGVTMVGIHARTGREKINDRNVAHVLNDETQRKYIQAVKRLMTQCQQLFPTVPSRSVEYQSNVVD